MKAIFEPIGNKPNILLIIADDLAFDHYGFAGHPIVQTPSLDSLASQSVRYPNTYVSSSCRATLATLLTGLPPHVHGVTYIQGPRLNSELTMVDRLNTVGYTTLQVGKFWEGPPTKQGFSEYLQYDSATGNLSVGRTSVQPLLELIEQSASPWFVWFSPYMPHTPHTAPQVYIERYEDLALDDAVVAFYAMISWFDDVVGEVIQALPEDTVIVYLADNGYLQSYLHGYPALRSKATSYEHGIRTQLLIRDAGHQPTSRKELVGAVDVTATILAMAGADHHDLPGRNVLASQFSSASVFGSRSILVGDKAGILQSRWMRRGEWKLVDMENGENRMFNLNADPNEENNLIKVPRWSALRDEMQEELEAWWDK
ncbi:MAG: sulfatase-like hydrolase/transferase [Halioglobus sp.]|nr:sulfatase-like hydrolase/transferase [Halioglobus sp.]